MPSRRIRRLLRAVVSVIVSLVLLVGLGIGYLRLTNPKPEPSSAWARLSDMPGRRGETAAANVGARFVVAGGLTGLGSASDAVSIYQIEKDEWGSGRRLPSPRHHAAAAALNGWVYVAGGSRSINFAPTDTVWRARPGGAWQRVARMPESRQGHAMVTIGDRMYVVGGVGTTNRTLIFDDTKKRWVTGEEIPAGRNHLRAVAWRNEVWAVGGRDGEMSPRADVYDPRRDSWRIGPSLPEPMSAMAVGVLDGALHVVGGEDPAAFGGGVIEAHYVLEPGTRRWTRAPKPVLPVHGAAYVVHGERLIVAGGASRQGALSVLSWTGVTQVYDPRGS